MRRGRLALIFGALTLVIAACGGDELTEQIIESQGGGDIEIDENQGTVAITIHDDEGDASAVIGGGEIPAGFPVPIPSGGDVMAVVESGGDTSLSLTFPQDQYDSLKSFYSDWASGAGEVLNSFEMTEPEPAASWSVESGDTVYNVTIGVTGSEVAVTIVVVSGD